MQLIVLKTQIIMNNLHVNYVSLLFWIPNNAMNVNHLCVQNAFNNTLQINVQTV